MPDGPTHRAPRGEPCQTADGRPFGGGSGAHAARRRATGIDADGLTNAAILRSFGVRPGYKRKT